MSTKFPWITLNELEMKMAIFLAKKRDSVNRLEGITQRQVSSRPHEEVELDGVAAEIAYARMMNVYPDTDYDHVPRPNEDCVNAYGQTVDVKASNYPAPDLIVSKSKKDKPCDVYAVMKGKFPTFRLVGHRRREDVFKDGNLKDLGRGELYLVPSNLLQPSPIYDLVRDCPVV